MSCGGDDARSVIYLNIRWNNNSVQFNPVNLRAESTARGQITEEAQKIFNIHR